MTLTVLIYKFNARKKNYFTNKSINKYKLKSIIISTILGGGNSIYYYLINFIYNFKENSLNEQNLYFQN